jgi:hypothetical protein
MADTVLPRFYLPFPTCFLPPSVLAFPFLSSFSDHPFPSTLSGYPFPIFLSCLPFRSGRSSYSCRYTSTRTVGVGAKAVE